jgi:hypothetical protein
MCAKLFVERSLLKEIKNTGRVRIDDGYDLVRDPVSYAYGLLDELGRWYPSPGIAEAEKAIMWARGMVRGL